MLSLSPSPLCGFSAPPLYGTFLSVRNTQSFRPSPLPRLLLSSALARLFPLFLRFLVCWNVQRNMMNDHLSRLVYYNAKNHFYPQLAVQEIYILSTNQCEKWNLIAKCHFLPLHDGAVCVCFNSRVQPSSAIITAWLRSRFSEVYCVRKAR